MRYIILLLLILPLQAQISVRVAGVTNTQAVLVLTGASAMGGTCTMTVRKDGPTGEVHPDWAGITGPSHPLTTSNTTEKFFVVGQKTGNKALRAAQQYYYSITGCGTASGTFTTKPTILGAIQHKSPKGDPNAWNGLDYPDVDLNSTTGRDKWYTHPVTGVPMRLITQAEDFSWMDHLNQTFLYPTGGVNWSNPTTIVNGSSSNATVTTTDPLYLYNNVIGQVGANNPWGSRNVENMGVVVWAQCVTGSGADCDFDLMLFTDPAVLPEPGTNVITVRANATFTQVTASHPTTGAKASTLSAAVLNGTTTFPGGTTGTDGFPRPHFQGWGNFTLRQDMYVRTGTVNVTVTGTDVSINGGLTFNNYFPARAMKPGQRIFITGAGAACSTWGVNDVCTVASVIDPDNITIVETGVPAGNTTARPLPWGLAVRKVTATGNSIRIGLMYRNSGQFAYTTGTTQPRCHPLTSVRPDGKVGRICLIPHGTAAHAWWISEDAEVVVPIDGLQRFNGDIVAPDFDPADPDSLILWHATNGLWRYTYQGDYGSAGPTVWQKDPGSPGGGARYAMNGGGTYPSATWSDPYWTATQIMTAASVSSQIATKFPAEVSSPYPAWNGSFTGIAGSMIVFNRLVEGQDSGPCQTAVFDINTGLLTDLINSATTPGTNGMHIFGNECHSIQTFPSVPNAFFSSMNVTRPEEGGTSFLLRGPHVLNITGVMRGGSFSANTCLEWPPGTSVTGCTVPTSPAHYDKTCPTVGAGANQIPQAWADQGAQGNNCVTLRVSGSTAAKAVCSQFGDDPSLPDDTVLYGACEWSAAAGYSGGPPLEKGARFVHISTGGTSPGDVENFRVLTIANTGDGVSQTIVVQRNSVREYCCAANGTVNPPSFATSAVAACGISNPPGDTRMTHTNGWMAQLSAGNFGCNQPTFYTQWPTPSSAASRTIIEVPISLAKGHSGVGRTGPTSYRYIGTGSSRNLANFNELSIQPPPLNQTVNAKYNGFDTLFGTYVQQYLSQTQIDITDMTNKYFSNDANHMNGTSLTEFNILTGGLASSAATRSTFATSPFADTWRINLAGQTVPTIQSVKTKPLVAWCGPAGLTNISSPATTDVVATMPMYTFCTAWRDGQCRPGSTTGQTWVKCPNVYRNPSSPQTTYYTGLEFIGFPSVTAASGNMGFSRRFRSDIPDETGNNQMLVSDAFKPAGTQYAAWSAHSNPGGTYMMSPSAGFFKLVRQVAWLMKTPKFPLEGEPSRASGLKRIAVQLGSRTGVTHARIRFGNNPQFQCNPDYLTDCLTDNTLTPYAFSDDTLTNQTCSSGCTLIMNVQPDEVLWYRVETTTNSGSTWTPDPVQVIVP